MCLTRAGITELEATIFALPFLLMRLVAQNVVERLLTKTEYII